MSHPIQGKLKDKLLVDLIEADVDMGFGLVDDAKAYKMSGQTELTSRALQNATTVLADIERRLCDVGEPASALFQPLIAELRNEIAEADQRTPDEEP